jgi:predicted TIM-barrel fold metal-dependent hydrolase
MIVRPASPIVPLRRGKVAVGSLGRAAGPTRFLAVIVCGLAWWGAAASETARAQDAPPTAETVVEPSGFDAAPLPESATTESGAIRMPLDGRDGRELLLRNFRPKQQLSVDEHLLERAAFPVIDVHSHFHYKLRDSGEALDDFVDLMDRNRIAVCVSLDGMLGARLEHHMKFLWSRHRDRFAIFANVNWQGQAPDDNPSLWACHQPGFAQRTAEQLQRAAEQGISGLKVFKGLGLRYRNPDGTLVKIDDPRWDPIWAKCGELGLPVIIHTADPAAFFEPIDETNERWEELSRHPDWSFYGDEYPSREELLAARNRVIARHPKTQFIGAHIANNPENLAEVSEWLDRYPNLWIEPASRIGELGRQPFTARDFLIRHQDRLLFGTDGPWPELRYHLYWRFFETRDESFPYSEKIPPPQGMWQIYGVDLPPEVLRKVYHENAVKLIPGIEERFAKWRRQHGGTTQQPDPTQPPGDPAGDDAAQ